MDTRVAVFLDAVGPVLCLDIRSGTQAVLLAQPGLEPENWTQLVLPSPAQSVAHRVEELTAEGRAIWLYGGSMDNVFIPALLRHREAGLSVSITQAASRTLYDSEAKVASMGIELREACPSGAVPVYLADYSPAFWDKFLRQLHLPQPRLVLAAVREYGVNAQGNCLSRMEMWRTLLGHSQRPASWLYDGSVPKALIRLTALQEATGGPVADTATATVLGALCTPEVRRRNSRQGVTVVNVGNKYSTAFLLYQHEVRGIFEHHTGMRAQDEYLTDLHEFRLAWLPDEQVRAAGGHGVVFAPSVEEAGGYMPTYVLGPRRALLEGQGQYIAPCGNMMLAGCYGLLYGAAERFSSN